MRKSTKRRAPRAVKPPVTPTPVDHAAGPIAAQEEAALRQTAQALHAQVATARDAFFRLASVRAADLVRYEGKGWGDGAAYINAEMAGLDAKLAAVKPE